MISKTLSVPEAAKALGVHRRTVLRRIASGTISAIVLPGRSGHEYRIRESEIEKYLKGRGGQNENLSRNRR